MRAVEFPPALPLDPAPVRTPVLQVPRMEPAPVEPFVVPDVTGPVRVLAETGDSWALMFLLVAVWLVAVGGMFVAVQCFRGLPPKSRYRRSPPAPEGESAEVGSPFPNLLGKH